MLKQFLKGKMGAKMLRFAKRRKGLSFSGLLGYLGWKKRSRLKRLVSRLQTS